MHAPKTMMDEIHVPGLIVKTEWCLPSNHVVIPYACRWKKHLEPVYLEESRKQEQLTLWDTSKSPPVDISIIQDKQATHFSLNFSISIRLYYFSVLVRIVYSSQIIQSS